MLKRILAGLTLAAALLLWQCGDNPVQSNQVKLGESFVLKLGQSVDVQGEALSVTFREVATDSRCPTGAMCFWAGIAETRVTLAKRTGDTAQVTVAILGVSEIASDERYAVDTMGYHIVLQRLDPYPDLTPFARNSRIPDPYQATLKVTRSIAALAPMPSVIITNIPPDSIQIDHFAIDSISILGDTLNLSVNYGGGCKNHYFFLYMSPATFLESMPVQANLWLRHFGNNDSCKCDGGKCYNHRKVRFDLKPIAELYRQTYQRIDPIILNIPEYTGNQPEKPFRDYYYPQGSQLNRAPQLAHLGPQSIREGDTLQLPISSADPDGTTPTLSAFNLPSNASFVDNGGGTGVFFFIPDTSQAGAYQVTFVASDGELADSKTVVITVMEVKNHAPALHILGSRSVVAGMTLILQVMASDSDGTIPVVTASDLPENAVFTRNTPTRYTFTFTPDSLQVGDHSILFVASDGLLADSETVVITVMEVENHAPALHIFGSRFAVVGMTLILEITAFDSDSTILVVTVLSLPANAVFEFETSTQYRLTFTPDSSQVGKHRILFVASDGELADSEWVTIRVDDASPLIPAAVGNHWQYEFITIDSGGGIGAAIDNLDVTASVMDSNGSDVWWTLSSQFPPFGTRFMVRRDSVFSGLGLEFIRTADEPVEFVVASAPDIPGFESLALQPRIASRLDSVVVLAGKFRNCYRYNRSLCGEGPHDAHCYAETYVIAPGVGIIEIDFVESYWLPVGSYEISYSWRLTSYKLEEP